MKWRTIEDATTKRVDGCCVTSEKMLVKGLIDDDDYRIVEANTMVNRNLMCVPVRELNAPELSESESERIRKAIIHYILYETKGTISEATEHTWVKWLEKQKEQKNYRKLYEDIAKSEWFKKAYVGKSLGEEDEREEQKPSCWDSPVMTNEMIMDEQKEQKPNIELIQRAWYMEGYHDREFGQEPKWIIKTGEDGPKHELNPRYGQPLADEQKPRWEINSPHTTEWTKEMIDEKFKELVEEYHKQNSTEWSEEDEKYLSQAIETLEHENYLILADKLKSLRPSWRPSEEQMKALIDCTIGNEYDVHALVRLWAELKKL